MKTIRIILQASALTTALTLALSAHAVLPAAGTVSTIASTIAGGRVTAGEHPWAGRMISYHPDVVVPLRMYSTSCAYNGQRRIFASFTSKTTTSSTTQGTIISANVAADGSVSGFTQRLFSECTEMSGIVATSDCSAVAAMCRRPSGSTGATKDLVAALPNTATGNSWRDWLTSEPVDDQMWLYEWKGTPALGANAPAPAKYVVAKAITQLTSNGWEYGHQNLVVNGTHYGVSMKLTTGKDSKGVQHQGDSFVGINRSTMSIDTARGWLWACGTGHTHSNHPVVSSTGAFAALCRTDANGLDNYHGGIWMHVEGKPSVLTRKVFHSSTWNNLFGGGAGSILPLPGGGYIGVIVSSDNPEVAQTTKIGIVRYNSDGAPQSTKWVVANAAYFMSYPQLVSLGNDSSGQPRFLLGWGRMMSTSTSTLESVSPDHTQRLASNYFVKEIDQYGNDKTVVREVVHGWGEQDQMVSLGNGMAGWVYTPDPRYRQPLPPANATALQWTTYKSTSM